MELCPGVAAPTAKLSFLRLQKKNLGFQLFACKVLLPLLHPTQEPTIETRSEGGREQLEETFVERGAARGESCDFQEKLQPRGVLLRRAERRAEMGAIRCSLKPHQGRYRGIQEAAGSTNILPGCCTGGCALQTADRAGFLPRCDTEDTPRHGRDPLGLQTLTAGSPHSLSPRGKSQQSRSAENRPQSEGQAKISS